MAGELGDFLQRCAPVIEGAQSSFAVLTLDLDDFTKLNGRYGRIVGDQVLRIVGARLSRVFRAEDIVGRVGNDEFACLIAGVCDQQALNRLACKALDSIADPMQIGDLGLTLSASAGTVIWPRDGHTIRALLTRAEIALRYGRRHRMGWVMFDARVHESSRVDRRSPAAG